MLDRIRKSRTMDALFCAIVLGSLIWMLLVDGVLLPTSRQATVPPTAGEEPLYRRALAELPFEAVLPDGATRVTRSSR
ncbi:hypothetical protein ABI59_09740 [Acidobacteria bacterium Mor1]|nr:hypothetical protein ABI59_09740 [Acidobacteria bacterium Mor1]